MTSHAGTCWRTCWNGCDGHARGATARRRRRRAAIDFYTTLLGATVVDVLDGPEDAVAHAELDVGTVTCSRPIPGGRWWIVAAMTRVEDVSEEEADRRLAAWASGNL